MKVQYSGNIDLTDEVLDLLADKVAERLGDSGTDSKASAKKEKPAKTTRRGKKAAEENDNSEAVEAFKTEMEELTEGVKAKEVKEFLSEWDYKSIGHCDPKDFDDILEAAREEFGGDEEGEDESDEEITVDVVKPLCQKAAKLDKDAMAELYEEFEISGIRGLTKLGEEDLEDLHAAVTEIIEEAE